MAEPSPATGRQLWRLNVEGRLREALDRCPSGVIDRETAREVLASFMPDNRRPPDPDSRRAEREKRRESNRSAHALIQELDALERRIERRRR